jgi:hypothetical protein
MKDEEKKEEVLATKLHESHETKRTKREEPSLDSREFLK